MFARAFKCCTFKRAEVHRTDTVRLVLTPEQEELLRNAAEAVAKFIESENLRRKQLFFEKGVVDDAWMTAWVMRETVYFEIYGVLGVEKLSRGVQGGG